MSVSFTVEAGYQLYERVLLLQEKREAKWEICSLLGIVADDQYHALQTARERRLPT